MIKINMKEDIVQEIIYMHLKVGYLHINKIQKLIIVRLYLLGCISYMIIDKVMVLSKQQTYRKPLSVSARWKKYKHPISIISWNDEHGFFLTFILNLLF